MKCLILAAGYATRLYPLTEHFPKPLLEVGEKTILDHLIDDIEAAGEIGQYIVLSNHRFAHLFRTWAKGRREPITVLDDGTETNETRLGAVRDIEFAIKELSLDEDLLVIAGDNLLEFSLTLFISYAKKKQASCAMRYYESETARLKKSGVVTVSEDDRILKMTEKSPTPESNWCCPPFYYYTKEDARLVSRGISEGCGVDAPGSYLAWLASHSPVYAMEMPGRRFDIGDLASYEEVKQSYRGIIK